MKRISSCLFWVLLVVAGILTSCGSIEELATTELGPEDGAREWIDAITNQDGNRRLKHTCQAQREVVNEATMWFSAFSILGQMFTNRSVAIEGDVSDLKFETISQTDNQAEVRVYGELRLAVLGSAQAQQVNERWLMVYENDTWRWCGSIIESPVVDSNTPGELPSNSSATVNGLKLDVLKIEQNVNTRKEGWKQVKIILASENVTEIVQSYPSGFCGILIDTGGFERQASSTLDHQGTFILAPGIRVKQMVIESEIPINQEPKSLALYGTSWNSQCDNWQGPSGPAWSFSDLTQLVDELKYPYDAMPTIAPTVENGVFQHEEPGLYKIELSNFRIEQTDGAFQLYSDYKVENTGGYDLRFVDHYTEPSNNEHHLLILGGGSTGRYIEIDIETERIGPGTTNSGELYLGYFNGKPDDQIYLSLVPGSRSQPVAQMIFDGEIQEPTPKLKQTAYFTVEPTEHHLTSEDQPFSVQVFLNKGGNNVSGYRFVFQYPSIFKILETDITEQCEKTNEKPPGPNRTTIGTVSYLYLSGGSCQLLETQEDPVLMATITLQKKENEAAVGKTIHGVNTGTSRDAEIRDEYERNIYSFDRQRNANSKTVVFSP